MPPEEVPAVPDGFHLLYKSVLARHQLSHLLDWADVVCIGCGLGMGQISEKILKNVLKNVSCPCVIDADGLNLLSRNIELLINVVHL